MRYIIINDLHNHQDNVNDRDKTNVDSKYNKNEKNY